MDLLKKIHRKANIKVSDKSSTEPTKEVHFIGYIYSKNSIKVQPSKTEVWKEQVDEAVRRPRKVKVKTLSEILGRLGYWYQIDKL